MIAHQHIDSTTSLLGSIEHGHLADPAADDYRSLVIAA